MMIWHNKQKSQLHPTGPTRLEIEEHEVALHKPYRSWCVPCVAGRGKADLHRGRDHTEDGVITLGIDRGYLNGHAKP